MAKKQAKMKNKATYAKKSKKQNKQVAHPKAKQTNKKVNQVKKNTGNEKKEKLIVHQEVPVSSTIQEEIKEESKVVDTPILVKEEKQEEVILAESSKEPVKEQVDHETKQLNLDEIHTIKEVLEPIQHTEEKQVVKANFIDLFTKSSKYIHALAYDGSSGHILSLLVKHGIAVIGIVMYLTHTLNESGFSVARLNFTQSCFVWVRVALFLFLAEVIATCIFVVIKEKRFNTKKMSELFYYSRKTSLVFVLLLNILGLAYYVNSVIGFIVLILVLLILINIRIAILNTVFKLRKNEIIKDLVILYLLFIISFMIFANLFLTDLSVIFQALN